MSPLIAKLGLVLHSTFKKKHPRNCSKPVRLVQIYLLWLFQRLSLQAGILLFFFAFAKKSSRMLFVGQRHFLRLELVWDRISTTVALLAKNLFLVIERETVCNGRGDCSGRISKWTSPISPKFSSLAPAALVGKYKTLLWYGTCQKASIRESVRLVKGSRYAPRALLIQS